MKVSGGRIIKIVLVGILAFLIIFQIYQSSTPVTTGSVIFYETYDGIDISAVAIRDETLIYTKSEGVLSYNLPDGGKIEHKGAVANLYASQEAANDRLRANELQQAISDLEEIEGYNKVEAVDIDMLDVKIDDAVLKVAESCETGETVVEGSDELLKLLNRRQIALGQSDGFSGLLAEYRAELKNLESSKAQELKPVTAKKPGYFVSVTDGYEGVLKASAVDSMTPSKLSSLKPSENRGSGRLVGKIVSDYEWYLAANISLDDSAKLTEETELTLLTHFDSVPELPVKVKRIDRGTSGDTALVIFSCTYMNSDLATMRRRDMTVVLKTYEGLRVSNDAIRHVDNKKGVYVLTGTVISFVPVEVVHYTETYCICKAETTGTRLKLYDEVIVKGKNLYDGKVID